MHKIIKKVSGDYKRKCYLAFILHQDAYGFGVV